ncbi:MoaD/ThiS family protein [Methanobrevibacter curvatus]|uniref:ThiS family protein n=1 Tax=Methanobrevibacter curvatus TaxID=49547 RepID=A0A166CTR0_9EURY|nr:MoaD/ThiS family protein [Methanobrevibacter curvatus]KZX14854.1 ThiS family protein [Methanobrevibacter curvatus]
MTYTLIFENQTTEKPFKSGQTIQNLLDELDISSETLVIKKNNEIVIEEAEIEEGDEIRLIQIIYGG